MPISAPARVARARRVAGLINSWVTPIVVIVKSSRLKRPASGPVTGKSRIPRSSVGSGRRSAAIAADCAASTPAVRAMTLGASRLARSSAASNVSGSAASCPGSTIAAMKKVKCRIRAPKVNQCQGSSPLALTHQRGEPGIIPRVAFPCTNRLWRCRASSDSRNWPWWTSPRPKRERA